MIVDFTLILALVTVQALLGAFDTLWHHELVEGLPGRVSARFELGLHAARELIYAGVFLVLAWLQPNGLLAWLFAVVLLVEILITLTDFIEEDRTRTLPPPERVLHTVMAILYGGFLVMVAPHILAWAGEPTGLVAVGHGAWSWVLTVFAAGVFAWGVRDTLATLALYRRAAEQADEPAAAPSGRTVLVTGGTGFLGQRLVRRRLARGDTVIVLSRDIRKVRALFDGRVHAVDDLDLVAPETRIDAVINLAGARVADMPWWPFRRRQLLDSRLTVTAAITRLIARLQTKPDTLISASAIGAYGDRGETALPEHASRPLGVFTADLCRVWEMAAEKARRHTRVCILRFGLVLGREDGVFPRLAMTRPFGFLPRFGDGRQWMGWIHVEDALDIIEKAILDGRMAGALNAVAPGEARHGEVIDAIAGGRWVIPVPAWALKTGLGEMSDLFLASQRVRPARLQALLHTWRYAHIQDAVAELVGKPERSDEVLCTNH